MEARDGLHKRRSIIPGVRVLTSRHGSAGLIAVNHKKPAAAAKGTWKGVLPKVKRPRGGPRLVDRHPNEQA
jgi:hypothetical protein